MAKGLTLYMRIGCSLCEQMQIELEEFRGQLADDIELIDIDADAALAERFGTTVPVLWGPEGEICHFFLDAEKLRHYFTNH